MLIGWVHSVAIQLAAVTNDGGQNCCNDDGQQRACKFVGVLFTRGVYVCVYICMRVMEDTRYGYEHLRGCIPFIGLSGAPPPLLPAMVRIRQGRKR